MACFPHIFRISKGLLSALQGRRVQCAAIVRHGKVKHSAQYAIAIAPGVVWVGGKRGTAYRMTARFGGDLC